ncbi:MULTISPECIES: DUF4007 family protein [Spirulina sp. CCY15215]|uniref:DUF4007 family protein n=1 Tax=Spirulina sp. CCY15215 TaxID=2767591 RepID=UPI00194F0F4E|nr:DUF4007 family protein [Spirulina major]
MPRLQLSFHSTFALKKEDIIKILRVTSEEKGLDDSLENLMQRTGLGNKKVRPMITWVSRGGLVKNKNFTPEGEIVWKCDRHLESIITEWLMHFYLSFGKQGLSDPPDNPAEWGGWTYFVYTFIPENSAFSTNELEEKSACIFNEDSSKRINKDFRILLRAYTEKSALANCQFIQKTKADKYQIGQKNLPNSYLIGYFLAKLWERDFGKETSVLTDDIIHQKMGLVPVLGINSDSLQQHLNRMESLGIIEQRRTVSPHQIIRRWDKPLTLLEKSYVNN